MLIDWTTVAFQIINFLLLIAVLKRFLYGPITRAMAKREADLAAIREEASRTRAEADAALASYRQQQRELEERTATLLRQAETDAAARRRELLDQARSAAEIQREQWRQALLSQQQDFLAELQRRSVASVLTVARRVLADLTDETLESALVRVLLTRLNELSQEEKARFRAAAQDSLLYVRSGFPADDALRQRLSDALRAALGGPVQLEWQHRPELLLGIEISSDGLRLAWGAQGYLEEVQQQVRNLFAQQRRGDAAPAADARKEAP